MTCSEIKSEFIFSNTQKWHIKNMNYNNSKSSQSRAWFWGQSLSRGSVLSRGQETRRKVNQACPRTRAGFTRGCLQWKQEEYWGEKRSHLKMMMTSYRNIKSDLGEFLAQDGFENILHFHDLWVVKKADFHDQILCEPPDESDLTHFPPAIF